MFETLFQICHNEGTTEAGVSISVSFVLVEICHILVLVKIMLAEHKRQCASQFDFNDHPLDGLQADIKSLIERVVICQDQYEMPTEDEVTRVLSLAVSSQLSIVDSPSL